MRELDELLTATLRDGEAVFAAERLSDDDLAVLSGRISARRARRHVLQGVVGLPIAAGVALAVWVVGGRHVAPTPVVTPTPTPSSTSPAPAPTPTPTPTPSPTPTATATAAALVPLPAEPGLPPRYEAPADILDRARPGWVLASYVATTWTDPNSGAQSDAGPAALLLVDPAGTAYQLLDLAALRSESTPGYPWHLMRIISWHAGATTALVDTGQYGGTSGVRHYQLLDLRTGALTPDPDLPEYGDSALAGMVGESTLWYRKSGEVGIAAPGGDLRWIDLPIGSGVLAASPDGRLVTDEGSVIDVASGRVLGTVPMDSNGESCEVISWWTKDALLASCSTGNDDDPQTPSTYRLVSFTADQMATGTGTEVASPQQLAGAAPVSAVYVGDRRVAVDVVPQGAAGACGAPRASRTLLLTSRSLSELPTADPRSDADDMSAAAGSSSTVVVQSRTQCWRDWGSSVLSLVDVASGRATSLLGLPEGTPPWDGPPAPVESWPAGVTTWPDALGGSWVVGR